MGTAKQDGPGCFLIMAGGALGLFCFIYITNFPTGPHTLYRALASIGMVCSIVIIIIGLWSSFREARAEEPEPTPDWVIATRKGVFWLFVVFLAVYFYYYFHPKSSESPYAACGCGPPFSSVDEERACLQCLARHQ